MTASTVHVAVICHDHGEAIYASATPEGMRSQVAAYCREWWDRELPDVDMPPGDDDVIFTYFDLVSGEWWIDQSVGVID